MSFFHRLGGIQSRGGGSGVRCQGVRPTAWFAKACTISKMFSLGCRISKLTYGSHEKGLLCMFGLLGCLGLFNVTAGGSDGLLQVAAERVTQALHIVLIQGRPFSSDGSM
jgi:hypothetical protein